MQHISRYITLADAIKSDMAIRYGISNTPDSESVENMRLICNTIYDPMCDYFKRAIPISSFYRCGTLNKKIGGSYVSQHCKGQAIDLDCDSLFDSKITNDIVFYYILNNLKFDQLIWEFGSYKKPDWVHVSFTVGMNRGQVLVAKKDNKRRTVYESF